MSLLLTGGVAVAYAAGVVTVHRVTVARRRQLAQGYLSLKWLDWGALLEGLLNPAEHVERGSVNPIEGGPPLQLFWRSPAREVLLLESLVKGEPVQDEALQEVFSGGDARWLGLLSLIRERPLSVLEELQARDASTVAEVYLREWLTLEYAVTALNLELITFGAKQRLNRALRRFGDHAALYFVRARASSLLGFTQSVLDDVARAVYFSRRAPFYLEAVGQMTFVDEVRPALARACRDALRADGTGVGTKFSL